MYTYDDTTYGVAGCTAVHAAVAPTVHSDR